MYRERITEREKRTKSNKTNRNITYVFLLLMCALVDWT